MDFLSRQQTILSNAGLYVEVVGKQGFIRVSFTIANNDHEGGNPFCGAPLGVSPLLPFSKMILPELLVGSKVGSFLYNYYNH